MRNLLHLKGYCATDLDSSFASWEFAAMIRTRCSLLIIRFGVLVALCLSQGLFVFAADAPDAESIIDPKLASKEYGDDLLWYDIRSLGVEGRGWDESKTKAAYDRLPAKAEGVVRSPVWSLSQDSAGMVVRFRTNASQIAARWTLRKNNLAMNHMPATGVSGVDLYVRDAKGKMRWVAVGRPSKTTNQQTLLKGIDPEWREYYLYLPLYNGVSEVYLGLPADAQLAKAEAWSADRAKPIVFYGTSITQGGCASRTGMPHPAILGRRLNRPTINLGFSGNGIMEPEVGQLLSEIDAGVYVLDCLPNMGAGQVTERVEPLVQTLRKAHPETPIVLVEDRTYGNAHLVKSAQQRNDTSRAALQVCYENLKKAGVKNLFYIPGENLLVDDSEGTVDGSHPTDLGFVQQADAMQAVLEAAIKAMPKSD